jgi:hypothetical protein
LKEEKLNIFLGINSKKRKKAGFSVPVTIRTATVAEIVAVEMTNTATDNAPMYIAARKAKNRAKKPPAAAKDMRREMTIALKVAARKKSINTSTPVKERRAIVPTCNSLKIDRIMRSPEDKI